MRILAHLARATVLAAIALLPAAARAQDGGIDPTGDLEIEVRRDVTPFEPGTPVAGALAAFVADGVAPADAEAGAVRADERGALRLPYRPGGGVVLVWGKDCAPTAVHVTSPAPFSLPVAAPVVADVLVRNPAGAGVGGAEVTAEVAVPVAQSAGVSAPFHRYRLRAQTAGDGRARFEGLPPVPIAFSAHLDGFVDAAETAVDPSRGATLVLGRGSRVSGSLRLVPGGVPGAGAVVRLGARTATVAPDGTFAVETVPPGAATLTFAGRGFVPPAPRTLVVTEGEDRAGVDVTASRTSALVARVVAPEDQVVAGVRVVVAYPPGAQVDGVRETFARPDAEGRVRVEELPPWDGAVVTVSAPGFVAARVDGVSLPAGEDGREIRFVLQPGATLEGGVTDRDGTPVRNATIVAYADAAGAREWARSLLGDDGRFLLDGLGVGETWLRVPGRPVGDSMRFGPFAMEAYERRDVGTLSAFAGWRLEGRATGAPDGTVALAVRDRAEIGRTRVEAEAFAFEGLSAGPMVVSLVRDGVAVASAPASVPAALPVDVPYRAPVPVHGRVADATGRPVVAADILATPLDGGREVPIYVRDPTGSFEATLVRGRWRLEATDGADRVGVVEIRVPEDALGDLVVRIAAASSVRGRLLDEGGDRPLEGAVVRAVLVGDRITRVPARADAQGVFRLAGVPPGVVRLRIESEDRGTFETEPRVVRALEEVDFGDIEIPRGTRLRGDVWSDGLPVRGGTVEIVCDSGAERSAETDGEGRFLLPGLPPGGAVLRVWRDGSLLRTQRVRVPRTWDDWLLRIDLDAGTRVFGRVTTGGRPEPFARVVLRVFEPYRAEVAASADEAGEYALPPVPGGRGEVEVLLPGAGADGVRLPAFVVHAADQRLDLEMPEASVEGIIEGFDTSAPVPGASLELRDPRDGRTAATGRSDAAGRFELPRIPPGAYELLASAPGFGSGWVNPVVVRRGVDTQGVRVVLAAEGRLALRAVDRQGQGVSTAWAVAWRDETPDGTPLGPVVRAAADGDGRIRVDGLARGPWHVAVGSPGRSRAPLGVVAVEEGVRDLGEVWLEDGTLLIVSAVGGGARRWRMTGIEVDVRDLRGGDPRPPRRPDDLFLGPDPLYFTGADGTVEIPGLAAGTYVVRPRGRPDAELRIRVRAGEVTRVLLPVPETPPPEPGPR